MLIPRLSRSLFVLPFAAVLSAQSPKPRARDLGISPMIGGTPGALDAITDVAGALTVSRISS